MKSVILIVLLTVSWIPLRASSAVLETATTFVTIESIKSLINGVIDTATNRGDYLLFKGATELKGVIDSWEKANSRLLTQVFVSLDAQQQRFIRDLDNLVVRLNDSAADQLETTRQIALLGNQTVNDAKFWSGKAAILYSSLSVVHPAMTQNISITIRGVSLDDANPRLHNPSTGQEFSRVTLNRQEATFELPKNAFTFNQEVPTRLQLEIIYTNPQDGFAGFFGAREEVALPLSLLQLPTKLAGYEVFVTTSQLTRHTQTKYREFSFSSGDYTERCEIQQQEPSNDYVINVDTIAPTSRPHPQAGKFFGFVQIPADLKLPEAWGRGGNWKFESKLPHGFAVKLCATRWHGPGLDSGPGDQHVYIRWEEYRDSAADTVPTTAYRAGVLGWNADEGFDLPPSTKAIRVRLQTFDGKVHEATYSKPFEFVEIDYNSSTKQMVIRPKIPSTLKGL